MMEKGLVGIICGEGKGKTTSAIGLAVRSAGWGKKILIVQFFKGQKASGERKILKKLKNIKIKAFGGKNFVNFKKPTEEDKKVFKIGWRYLQSQLAIDRPDLLILDEINLAIYYQLIGTDKVVDLINQRGNMDIVFTGRKGKDNKEIVKLADFVSQIKNLKHHFNKGIKAKKGIEY